MIFFLIFGHIRTGAGKFIGHQFCCDICHVDVADLGYQRHGTGGPGVRFQNVYLSFADGILHIHQSHNTHFTGYGRSIFPDQVLVFFGNLHRRDHTGGISGVDAGLFNMLHNRRNKGVGAVRNSVCLAFQGVLKKLVHKDRALRRYVDGRSHIVFEHIIIINDFHASSA